MAKKFMLDNLNRHLKGFPDGVLNAFTLVYDEIDDDVAKQVTQWIIECNFEEKPPAILNMMINSPGGSLHSAFAIIDIMKSSKIPIRTIGLGQIASAGLMIFLAGTKGDRILTPNTSIMSHQFSAGSLGKEHELFAVAKEFTLASDRMMAHYKKTTGLSEANIRKYLLPPTDVYLSAEEALKHGICDKVADLS